MPKAAGGGTSPAQDAAAARFGAGPSLGADEPATAGAGSLRQGLIDALAGIGEALQAGLSSALREPSRAAAAREADLRLQVTVDRYFQF